MIIHLDMKQRRIDKTELYYWLEQVDNLIANALAENTALMALQEQPCCASCGATGNLTAGYAGGNEISYCPVCKADEEQR